jgi:hypothetical protein
MGLMTSIDTCTHTNTQHAPPLALVTLPVRHRARISLTLLTVKQRWRSLLSALRMLISAVFSPRAGDVIKR